MAAEMEPGLLIMVKRPKSDGFATWTEDEIAMFEAHWPIGSKPRLAMSLALYLGQRRGDLVALGPQHIKNGVVTIRQQKTGVPLVIPVHPKLQEIIDRTPTGHLTLLVTQSGKSYGANDFSEMFRSWCDAAGLPGHCSVHGLRKAALTRLADAGCSVHEIAAISGHQSLKMIAHYTAKADQAKLARAAMERRATAERTANESVKSEPGKVSKLLKKQTKKAAG